MLKSNRFKVALAALAGFLLSLLAKKYLALDIDPRDAAIIFLALAGFLIGGYTVRDAGAAVASGPQNLKDAIAEVFYDILDEYYVELDPGAEAETAE